MISATSQALLGKSKRRLTNHTIGANLYCPGYYYCPNLSISGTSNKDGLAASYSALDGCEYYLRYT
jgi:hypothetical protein